MNLEAGSNILLSQEHIAQSRESILLIEWLTNSLNYSIYNEKSNQVVCSAVAPIFLDLFDYNEQEFNRLISEQEVFQYSFKKTIALIDTPYFTLIPTVFYNENKLEELLRFNVKLPSGNLAFKSVELIESPYFLVYSLPKNILKSLENSFLNIEYKPLIEVLIEQNLNNNSKTNFHCHISPQSFMGVYTSNQKLIFANRFNYEAPEDLVYNVLNIFQQLGLNNELDTLYLSGSISKESDFYKLLYKYIRNIQFKQQPSKLNFDKSIETMPHHYFTHHYQMFL